MALSSAYPLLQSLDLVDIPSASYESLSKSYPANLFYFADDEGQKTLIGSIYCPPQAAGALDCL